MGIGAQDNGWGFNTQVWFIHSVCGLLTVCTGFICRLS